jgi:hypothetical protein
MQGKMGGGLGEIQHSTLKDREFGGRGDRRVQGIKVCGLTMQDRGEGEQDLIGVLWVEHGEPGIKVRRP